MPYAIVVVALFCPVIAAAARAIHRRRATAVFGYLEQAVRLNQPLPVVLVAASRSERGVMAARLFELSNRLQLGISLADALVIAVPEVPRRQIAVVRCAKMRVTWALRCVVSLMKAPARATCPSVELSRSGMAGCCWRWCRSSCCDRNC